MWFALVVLLVLLAVIALGVVAFNRLQVGLLRQEAEAAECDCPDMGAQAPPPPRGRIPRARHPRSHPRQERRRAPSSSSFASRASDPLLQVFPVKGLRDGRDACHPVMKRRSAAIAGGAPRSIASM